MVFNFRDFRISRKGEVIFSLFLFDFRWVRNVFPKSNAQPWGYSGLRTESSKLKAEGSKQEI